MNLEVEENIETNYNQIIQNAVKEENRNNLENSISNNLNYSVTSENQNQFLNTTIGKTINTALNVGLRYLLPDVIENQVIDIKDTIINEGFKEGINKAVDSAIDLGKSAMGIVTGKFDNVSQIQTAVEKGGLIDTISNSIDFGLKIANESGVIPKDITKIIKTGKNVLIDNIESNIESTLTNQLKGIEKVNKYINNWNRYYKEQNFDKMQLEYDKIREKLKDLVPLEETLKNAHKVENLHKLIKNKGKDFNLSEEEIALAEKLI